MFKSTSQLIAIILGVGMVGQNFFVLNMLSKRESDMPNLAQLKTTDNSSSQMTYKREGEKLDVYDMSFEDVSFCRNVYEKLKIKPLVIPQLTYLSLLLPSYQAILQK